MNTNLEITAVGQCSVSECAYKAQDRCHAKAITIGDANGPPCCDTMICGHGHTHATELLAGVGACKVESCAHNPDLECTADSIAVGYADEQAKCMTYLAR